MDFGEMLKKARLRQGISQRKLAKEAGLSSNGTISQWETGIHSPRIEDLEPVLDALNQEIVIRSKVGGDNTIDDVADVLSRVPELDPEFVDHLIWSINHRIKDYHINAKSPPKSVRQREAG